MKNITLASLLCLLLLVSCGDGAQEGTVTTDAAADSVTAEINTEELTEMQKRALMKDDLPETSFDGKQFRISTKEGTLYEIDIEEETGDLIDDALYARNRRIEERFNVEIVPIITSAGDLSTHVNAVKQSILASDDAFDLAATYVYTSGSLVTEGYYLNWLEMPYNDMSKPWWINGVNENFRVGDAMYTAVGDMCLSTLQLTYGMFYNRTKGLDYDLNEKIYERVFDGTWTLDYFMTLIADVYTDLNGDGVRDKDDFYGFTAENATNLDIYTFAFDIPIVSRDENDMPQLVMNTEKTVAAIEKINALYWETTGTFIPTGDYSLPITMFANGHALFTTTYLMQAFSSFREMTDDYSILPYPKWDENQEKYMTGAMDNYSVLGIPITVTDIEMVSIITEALNIESYKTLYPTYYEQALQNKYARDTESIEMIDMLMQGRTFDFSTLFTTNMNFMSTLFRDVINAKTMNFASQYKRREKEALKGLEDVLEAYEKNADN